MSELKVVIGADDSKLLSAAKRDEKELGKVGEAAEKAGQRADKAFDDAADSVEDVGTSAMEASEIVEKAGKRMEDALGKVEQAAEDAKDEIGSTGDNIAKEGKAIASSLGEAAKAAGAFFAVDQLKEFAKEVVNVRKQMQGYEISLSTLLGSNTAGSAMMEELKEFAATTPLMLDSLASGAQTMLGFNIEAEKVVPTMKAIGDISMGDSQKFQSLTLAFSQMSATGKLMGQDLLQMINAGFNPLMEISRKTGKSISELKDEMSEGAISADMVAEAFASATSEGGQFYGMLEKQGQGLAGQINAFKGALDDMYNSLGEKSEGVVTTAIQGATELVRNYENVGKVLAVLVGTYGAYKAAVIAVTAVENAHKFATIAATTAQRVLNATMLANPYVAAAAALGLLVTALIAFSDRTSTAEKLQEAFNKREEEAATAEEEHRNKLTSLITAVNDETKSEEERTAALEEAQKVEKKWVGGADTVLDKYATYTEYVNDAANAQKLLNEELERTNKLQGVKDYNTDKQTLDTLREIKKLRENSKGGEYAGKIGGLKAALPDDVRKLLSSGARNVDELIEAMKLQINGGIDSSGKKVQGSAEKLRSQRNTEWNAKWLSSTNVKDLESELKRQADSIKGVTKEYVVIDGVPMRVKDIQARIDAGQAQIEKLNKKDYGQNYRAAEKRWKEALKAYNNLQANKDKFSVAEAAAIKKEKEEAEKAFKETYGGDTTGKSNKAAHDAQKQAAKDAQALADLQDKLAKENARKQKDYELNAEQERINALKEGGEKTLAQIELNYQKEVEAIKRGKEDALAAKEDEARALWEAENAKLKRSGNVWEGSLDQQEFRKNNRLTDEEQQYFKNREKANEETHARELAKQAELEAAAMRNYLKEYGTYQQQRLAIAEEYADRIKKAQTEGEKLTLKKEQEKALADVDMRELNAKVDWEVIFNDLDKVSKSHLQQLRDNLEAYLKDGIKKGTISPENAKVIAERVAAINKEVQSRAVFSMKGATAQGYDDAKTRMQAQLDELKAKQTKATADELGQLSEQIISVIDAMADLEKQEKSAKTQAREIGEGFSKVAQQLQGLSNLVDAVGLGNTNFGESVKNVASGVSNAASAFTNFADGNWFQSAADAVTAIQDFGRAFGIGGGNADEVVRTTERLTKANELLTRRVSDLTDAIGNSAGLKAMAAYEAAMEAQEEINENNLEVLRQQMGYNNAHHSNAYYADDRKIASYNAQAQKAFKAAGVKGASITGLESMMMLSPEQMKALRDFVPELWKYVTTVGKYDKSDFWDKVVEQAGKAEKLTEQIRNNLTQTSFDGLRSSWLDTLTDMEVSSEDFAQSFEDMMYKAVVNALVLDDEFDEWLEDWQEKYAKAVKNGNMAMLEQLESESAAMREQKVQQADEYALQMGYRRGSTGATATVNAAKSIGEDTAQDIVGRMTSIQLSNEREATAAQTIAASMTTAMSHLASLTQQAEASRGVLTEMRTLMIYGNSYLEDIAKHTKAMHEEWGMKIDRMTNKLENL